MKKIILFLYIISVSANSLSISIETCRDVLNKIKEKAPYIDTDAATLRAAQIAREASKIQNNLLSSKEDKQNAMRQAECAEFFNLAGVYYTAQMNFELLHKQFIQEQKNNSSITQREFLKTYLEKQADKNTLDKLLLQTRDRMRNQIATKEEKAQGRFWSSILEDYKKENLPRLEKDNEQKEEEQANIEKYIR